MTLFFYEYKVTLYHQ